MELVLFFFAHFLSRATICCNVGLMLLKQLMLASSCTTTAAWNVKERPLFLLLTSVCRFFSSFALTLILRHLPGPSPPKACLHYARPPAPGVT